MKNHQVFLASKNKDKALEVSKILKRFNINVILADNNWAQPEENRDTLEGNAELKALSCAEEFNEICLADDTGLFVEALDGKPGVHSSRFAGDNATYRDNNLRLLKLLNNIPPEKRTAYFKTVVVCARKGEVIFTVSGVLEGTIISEFRGESGFGYDPIFYLPEYKKTLAELSLEEKNEISHRRKAFEKAGEELLEIAKDGII
jgi:XTP/dITP diphosphohydrolase